jgi:hypothetical protein
LIAVRCKSMPLVLARPRHSSYDLRPFLVAAPNMKKFLFLLLLLVVVLGFGYMRGWFGTSTVDAGGKSGIVLTWNKDKFKADMSAAGGKIKQMSQAAVDKVKGKAKTVSTTESELEGKIISVDVANHIVTIESNGDSIPLTVFDTAGIEQLNGKTVRVVLEKTGDSYVVREIAEKK